jgi:CRISPR-associated endonuclease/helicase Cas3
MTLLAKSADDRGVEETLLSHSLRVVEATRQLCDRLPFPTNERERLKKELDLAAALHDVGKGASGFQRCLRNEQANWNGWRHEVLSAAFASNFAAVSEEVVFAVLTHHKQIPGQEEHGTLRWFAGYGFDGLRSMCREFAENSAEIVRVWERICNYIGRPELKTDAAHPPSGVGLRPGWLDAERQRRDLDFAKRREASLVRGLLVSGDHLASGHAVPPPMVRLRDFPVGIEPRPFQELAGLTLGHAILCAPTGSGKTEAALLWAAANQGENGRLFYVLPYTAAINAMHARLQGFLKGRPDSVGLLHGRAAHHLYACLAKDYPGDAVAAQGEAVARARLAREMYHPVRVCTPQQLLRYTLHGRGWEQMLAEIPGACLVFDEVHSYDPELAGLTLGTARLFAKMGAKTLFVSATLPRFLRKEIQGLLQTTQIAPDPGQERDRHIMNRKRHFVEIRRGTVLDAVPEIVEKARSGRSVLVVCNHVRSAQCVYRALLNELGETDVLLFHGRFHMRDRRDKERALSASESPLPRVLVATQVVEVSLDISYDLGYFEPAPIDALAQRMGRVNRKGDTPVRVVVVEKTINSHPLYSAHLILDTLQRLAKVGDALAERDLGEICDEVYGKGYEGEQRQAFEERLNHPFFVDFERNLVAGRHERWTESVIDKADGRADVLPQCLRREYDNLRAEKRWLDADALLVNAPVRRYWRLVEQRTDPWEINLPYDSRLGLLEPGEAQLT